MLDCKNLFVITGFCNLLNQSRRILEIIDEFVKKHVFVSNVAVLPAMFLKAMMLDFQDLFVFQGFKYYDLTTKYKILEEGCWESFHMGEKILGIESNSVTSNIV